MSLWKDRFLKVEEIALMEEVFREKFLSKFKDDEDIIFEGYFSEGTLFITAIFKNHEETFYYPFETSINSEDNPNLKDAEARLVLLDFVDEYFDSYFKSDRNIFVPIDWAIFKFRDCDLYAKGQIINKKAEDEALAFFEKNACDEYGNLKKEN